MVEEQGGGVMAFDGNANLNPPGSVFFNDTGFALSGAQVDKAVSRCAVRQFWPGSRRDALCVAMR